MELHHIVDYFTITACPEMIYCSSLLQFADNAVTCFCIHEHDWLSDFIMQKLASAFQ